MIKAKCHEPRQSRIGRTLGTITRIGEEIKNPMGHNINAAIKAALAYEVDA